MKDLAQKSRKKSNRSNEPSYGTIDSKSVKTTGASENRGIDGGKKIKERKKHIVIDTQSHFLHVEARAANIHDTVAGGAVFTKAIEKYPSLKEACADDAGYRKATENFVRDVFKKTIEISKRVGSDWLILPQRWIVERTLSWLNHFRRLAKDYEIGVQSAVNMIMISHFMLLLTRLYNS